jgi:hypothetical protein
MLLHITSWADSLTGLSSHQLKVDNDLTINNPDALPSNSERSVMLRKRLLLISFVIAVFGFGFVAGRSSHPHTIAAAAVARPEGPGKVFELRTYTTNEGKLDALQARFRNHTIKLFEKHGMTSIGYWVPEDSPLAQHTLIYIIAHPSREAAKKNWEEFRSDPEWQKVKAESEASGNIVSKVDSVYMRATDYSALK